MRETFVLNLNAVLKDCRERGVPFVPEAGEAEYLVNKLSVCNSILDLGLPTVTSPPPPGWRALANHSTFGYEGAAGALKAATAMPGNGIGIVRLRGFPGEVFVGEFQQEDVADVRAESEQARPWESTGAEEAA